MQQTVKQFLLPDLISVTPFKSDVNPHHLKAAAESSVWINSFNLFSDKKRADFMLSYSELLCANVYPYAEFKQLRLACDFVNLLFAIDEVSDEQDGKDALLTGRAFLSAIDEAANGGSRENTSAIAQATRAMWKSYTVLAGPKVRKRFIRHCYDYISAVVQEAELRERGEVLNLESYVTLRRENSGVRPCCSLIECMHGIDLPDEVYDNEIFREAHFAAVDMVCWSNDVYSYSMEQSKDLAGNNLLTVLMKEKKVDLQTASDCAGEHYKMLVDKFISARRRMPSWNREIDSEIVKYLDGLQYWVSGNLNWSFEGPRYFGNKGIEIKSSRAVTLKAPDSERGTRYYDNKEIAMYKR